MRREAQIVSNNKLESRLIREKPWNSWSVESVSVRFETTNLQ